MARLRYTAITSLDGYVNDSDGGFAWAEPSDELHLVVNSLEREVGTHLLGRRLCETMTFWETARGRAGPMGSTPGSGGRRTRSCTRRRSRT